MMSELPSILNADQKIDLETSKEDWAVVLIKSISSIVPLGGTISEIISTIIPNQKLDRVIEFVELLNYKISNAEQKIENAELMTDKFTDLFEDAVGQASRALSKDRIEYLASFMKTSLTDKALEHAGKKKILALLDELNDVEVIWLKSYTFRFPNMNIEPYKSFYQLHKPILEPLPPQVFVQHLGPFDGTGELVNRRALRASYLSTLDRLGLIEDKFDRVKDGEIPKFDENTGRIKSSGTRATGLGKLIIDYIGLDSDAELTYSQAE